MRKAKGKTKQKKTQCKDDLRCWEYYNEMDLFDDLYEKSRKGKVFTNLWKRAFSEENILLAYRIYKSNPGSHTPGVDGVTIEDLGNMPKTDFVNLIRNVALDKVRGYHPRPIKRKEIPKNGGTGTRPLGIPCMVDRIIQQCIKQVLEPICEAKFSDNSYGFRPDRNQEQAIAAEYKLLQRSNLHYVVELDIKGFFDNVSHSKLIKQLWTMGIHDKKLLYLIKQILKAPVRMPDHSLVRIDKGTPQGAVLSPVLANVNLNEFDHWVEDQWEENPVIYKYSLPKNKNGSTNKGNGYSAMRKTRLKEVYAIRFADDIRLFCPDRETAEKVMHAATQFLEERLNLEVSQEKTRIVNTRRKYSKFLGLKIKVHKKGYKNIVRKGQVVDREPKYVVKSHMDDKALKTAKEKLTEQIKRIENPVTPRNERDEIALYNSMVTGIQNYFRMATEINKDVGKIQWQVSRVMKNRLGGIRGRNSRLSRTGRELTPAEKKSFGKSKMIRYAKASGEPVLPIGYTQHKHPMCKNKAINRYTAAGRINLHDNLALNTSVMREMARAPSYNRSTEYMDNRISLYSAQWGKCAVSGVELTSSEFTHCHHKVPKHMGGTDKYQNLILVTDGIHRLIHATDDYTIHCLLKGYDLNKSQFQKLNWLRTLAGLEEIRPDM